MIKNTIILGIALCWTLASFAQEVTENGVEQVGKHKLALVFGYTHIPKAFVEGHSRAAVNAPTIGFDYFYQFSERWGIGTVIDLEFANYIVDYNKEDLERERPIITGLLLGYQFAEGWDFLLGPGMEFEKNKDLFILRVSTEYELELGHGWGLFPAINYDFKKEYSTWAINLGISKRL